MSRSIADTMIISRELFDELILLREIYQFCSAFPAFNESTDWNTMKKYIDEYEGRRGKSDEKENNLNTTDFYEFRDHPDFV